MDTPQILITLALAIRSFCILSAPVMAEGIQRCGTITIGRSDEPLTLDPFVPSDDGSIYAIAQICEPLVSADKLGTGLVPGLAESWTTSEDGLTYTFKLRPDLKFSDGKPVTSADLKFSLTKVMDPAAPYGFAFQPVASLETPDDQTITINLKQPYTSILSSLSLFFGLGRGTVRL